MLVDAAPVVGIAFGQGDNHLGVTGGTAIPPRLQLFELADLIETLGIAYGMRLKDKGNPTLGLGNGRHQFESQGHDDVRLNGLKIRPQPVDKKPTEATAQQEATDNVKLVLLLETDV